MVRTTRFTSGCLAGVLEGLLQQPYSVAEDMVGEDERVFTFEKKYGRKLEKTLDDLLYNGDQMVPIIYSMEY